MKKRTTPRSHRATLVASGAAWALLAPSFAEAAPAPRLRAAAVFWLAAPVGALAEDVTVSGKVTQANGEGLPGVTVLVKGTTNGTSTNVEGFFSLTVPAGSTLTFSSVGYVSKELAIAGPSPDLQVRLEVDTEKLGEVVVVGYGTVRKRDLTGSVASVKAAEITQYPSLNVVQALSGRAAGVQVVQNSGAPGAAVSVRIRGTNSVLGNNEPLYVVDGFPTSGNPRLLNNADIESVEVLKDASATAIYGSRGANGVILITTKKGKAGRTQVDYDGSYSSQSPRKTLELMNPLEYATFYNEQARNDNVATPYFSAAQLAEFAQSGGTDWQDLAFRQAPLQSHSLNVSGGNEKTRFSLGGSYFQQDGIITNSAYKRYSTRFNVNHELGSRFSVTYGATLSRLEPRRVSGASSFSNRGNNLLSAVLGSPPTLTPYNDDGTYRRFNAVPGYPFLSNVLVNPLNFLNEQLDETRSNQVLGNLAVTYKPFKDLTLRVSGGLENRDERSDFYQTRNFINSPGQGSATSSQYLSLLQESLATYAKEFGIHSLNVVGGFTYQDFLNSGTTVSGQGFGSDVFGSYIPNAADLNPVPSGFYNKSALLSYLGRVNYSLLNRYLLTVSFRADGSSRYSPGSKWGYFPSAALAWRVVEEPFMKNVKFISDLKVRAGYGATGSQAIDPYSTLNILTAGKTVFNDALFTTFAPGGRLPNSLKWETTRQTDVGLDVAVLDNRVRLTADYYVKNTTDLLNRVQLPNSLGYSEVLRNVGEIQNQGVELALDAAVLRAADPDRGFSWDLGGNISFNRNKVVRLSNGSDINGGGINSGIANDFINLVREGEPLGVFYGFQDNGYSETGNLTYKDLDGNGVINLRDKAIIGNPNPDYTFGLNSTMKFRGLELTAFFQGSQGNDIYNLNAVQGLDLGFGLNQLKAQYNDHWTPDNRNAKYPKISRLLDVRYSDRFVEDGSYVRLKNVQLAYNLPTSKLGAAWLRNAQVYVSGQNLLTFTKYSWFDPEVNTFGGGTSITQGIDLSTYPTSRAVTVGVRLGL